MKPEDVLRAIEGHENIIKKAHDDLESFFKHVSCPSCNGDIMKVVNSTKPFKSGEILPNYLAKCKSCGIEFDPYTGIQISMPR